MILNYGCAFKIGMPQAPVNTKSRPAWAAPAVGLLTGPQLLWHEADRVSILKKNCYFRWLRMTEAGRKKAGPTG